MRFCETNPIVILANSVVTCSNVVSCDYEWENLIRVRLGKPNPFASKIASRRLVGLGSVRFGFGTNVKEGIGCETLRASRPTIKTLEKGQSHDSQ